MSTKWSTFLKISILSVAVIVLYSQLRNGTDNESYQDKEENIKYILQWTLPNTIPFVHMGKGQEAFFTRNCKHKNCFVTSNRQYLNSVTDFDAILFHGPEIVRNYWWLPNRRSPEQKYTYVSIESSHYYHVCRSQYYDFFNWTWTYKLDSDIDYSYIAIRDKNGNIIGPKKNMHWIKNDEIMQASLDEAIVTKLQNKTKAASWMVSNCNSLSKRENFVNNLRKELRKYHLDVDIFGGCGKFKCPLDNKKYCDNLIRSDYYFYLSFENSFSEDYVTEKLLTALKNYAVPIVFGGANYTRFMPDGAYLDAKKLGSKELARQMNNLIQNRDKYYDYFKWHNFYSYHDPDEAPDSDRYCQFCDLLNDDQFARKQTMQNNFQKWWNELYKC